VQLFSYLVIIWGFLNLPLDKKDVASDEFVTKQEVELRSKNQNPSTESDGS
jgi:hypothetical protein